MSVIDRHDGSDHSRTRPNQTSHGGGQSRNAVTRLPRLFDEGGTECPWQSNTKHDGEAADHGDIGRRQAAVGLPVFGIEPLLRSFDGGTEAPGTGGYLPDPQCQRRYPRRLA